MERDIRVGDHVRWTDPDMELNVVWEVVGMSRKNLHLRFEQRGDGRAKVSHRLSARGDCELVAAQYALTDAP